MTNSTSIVYSQAPLPTVQKSKGRGNKIVVVTVVKAKIGEFGEEVRAGSSRSMRKELTGVVQGVSGRRKFLVRSQNGCKKNLSLNQLTITTAHNILVEEAPEVSTIPEIPEDNVLKQKGYNRFVYVLLQFKTEEEIDSKEEQIELDHDPDEEEMGEVHIVDERERHYRNYFEDNEGGVNDKKALLHAKYWDLYVNEKEILVKGKYSVEFVGHDKRKVLWEVVGDHLVKEPSDHEDIRLRGFDFNISDEDEEGVDREG